MEWLYSYESICATYIPLVSQYQRICGYDDSEELGYIRSLVVMVPVLGNIVVLVYDWVRFNAYNRVANDYTALEHMCTLFKNDKVIVWRAVIKDERALAFASPRVQEEITHEIDHTIDMLRDRLVHVIFDSRGSSQFTGHMGPGCLERVIKVMLEHYKSPRNGLYYPGLIEDIWWPELREKICKQFNEAKERIKQHPDQTDCLEPWIKVQMGM